MATRTERDAKIEAVDLFCGAGGLAYGLKRAGIDVRGGVDLDSACKYPFETNNAAKFIHADVANITADSITPLFSEGAIRLLAGCAPCQPFSRYSNGRDTTTDDKWGLLRQFGRLVSELVPELVTMENVPQLADKEPFADFLKTLEDLNYEIVTGVVDCANFGVPQHRRRLVLMASRLGPVSLPRETCDPQSWITVRDSIGELPAIRDGESDPNDPLHRASKMSAVNKARIKASKPGGTWRDWPEDLVAKCHQKASGKSYPSVYGRMSWDEPAPTMTTLCNGFGNGRFGHPKQDRAISLREAAIFQSFPKKYKFCASDAPLVVKHISRLIGNAVPPKLGQAIGSAMLKHAKRAILEGNWQKTRD